MAHWKGSWALAWQHFSGHLTLSRLKGSGDDMHQLARKFVCCRRNCHKIPTFSRMRWSVDYDCFLSRPHLQENIAFCSSITARKTLQRLENWFHSDMLLLPQWPVAQKHFTIKFSSSLMASHFFQLMSELEKVLNWVVNMVPIACSVQTYRRVFSVIRLLKHFECTADFVADFIWFRCWFYFSF